MDSRRVPAEIDRTPLARRGRAPRYGSAVKSAPDTRYPKMTDPVLHLADFARYLNRTFTLRIPEGGAVTAELVEVEELTGTDSLDDRPREPFTLVFKLEEGAELIQRMYDVAHGDTVWRGMFLVPVQSRKQGHFVQAVFN